MSKLPQKKCTGLTFAEKLPAEPGEDPIHLDQDPPKTVHVFRIVGGVRGILFE